MRSLKYIWSLGLLFALNRSFGQDPHFTQFYANSLYLAPSFAGATEQHRISSIFRDQWPSVPNTNTYVTYAFSYDHFFANFNSGVGLYFMNDVAGSLKLGSMRVGLMYSYDFQVFNFWHIRPGATFSYIQRSLNLTNEEFLASINRNGQTVPVGMYGNEAMWDFDAAVSVLVYADKIWFGSCVDHLTMPDDNFGYDINSKVPLKISVFGGYQIVRKGRLLRPIDETVSLAFNYKNQDFTDQLDLGLYWFKSPLVFGLWYRGLPITIGKYENTRKTGERVGDMMAVLTGIKIPQFSLGYSYDFTVSKLVGQTGGAHEISMVYEFRTSRRKKIHAIPCPEF